MNSRTPATVIAVLLAALWGCGEDDECTVDATYQPTINPADFVAAVDNPLLPLAPGTRFTFEGGGETIEVSVTRETRVVQDVTCVVVRDTVTEGGQVTEDTYDWFAQDKHGNVWYMGEDTKEYENGKLESTEGSWEAGVDGAKAGIVMPAAPAVGVPYRQEYYACEAEDMAEVASLSESVDVPFGSYTGCLKTREYTPLESDVNEYKYYCQGVGMVLEVEVSSGTRVELTDVTTF